MHAVIGVITAVAGLIWAVSALQRSGLDLNALNPFLWHRRAQWAKKYAVKPLHNLDKPMEVAALLLLGVAKCEGEITSQQKKVVLEVFENEFRLSRREATDLFVASAHLSRNEIYLADDLPNILERSASKFTEDQVASLLALMRRIARVEGSANEEQERLVKATQSYFECQRSDPEKWG